MHSMSSILSIRYTYESQTNNKLWPPGMNSRTHGELVYCSIPVLLLSRSNCLFYVQNVLLISHELIACYSSSILMQKNA